MSLFFPRFTQDLSPFGHFGQEFAPISRYFEELDRAVNTAMKDHLIANKTNLPKFNPRFDVEETDEAYKLTGELPGLAQKDINIQFTNENTLLISGRTEHTREEGTRPGATQSIENTQQNKAISGQGEAGSEHSYHPPTVEEEKNDSTTVATTNNAAGTKVAKQSEPQTKYWLSERSVGEFQRTFPFPKRINQDGVKASLKDGILNVLVPKAKAPVPRRIAVE